jgi:hypothetical protein
VKVNTGAGAPSSSSLFSERYFGGMREASLLKGAPPTGARDDLGRAGEEGAGRREDAAERTVEESEVCMVPRAQARPGRWRSDGVQRAYSVATRD